MLSNKYSRSCTIFNFYPHILYDNDQASFVVLAFVRRLFFFYSFALEVAPLFQGIMIWANFNLPNLCFNFVCLNAFPEYFSLFLHIYKDILTVAPPCSYAYDLNKPESIRLRFTMVKECIHLVWSCECN